METKIQANPQVKKSSKLTIFSCIFMATGTIVGAGIFGSIPAAAKIVGPGIEWAYILAFLAIIVRFLPTIVTASVLPSPFCTYMHATRIVNPTLGFTQVIFGFNFVFILASLATVFAQYFSTYLPLDNRVLAVLSLAVFLAVTCFGARANAMVQNIMVALLIIALLLFVALGAPYMKPENLSFGDVLAPQGMTLVGIGAAVALLSATLQGGHNVMNYADEVKNPGKAIPVAFLAATFICTILFMLVSAITIGVTPVADLTTLKAVAETFMSPVILHFFIIAGAVFAILTSINGVFLSASRMISATAKDQVTPKFFDKRNKHGVAYSSVLFLGIGASIIVAFGIPIAVLLSAFSLLTLICNLILFIPAMKVHKLYPNSYKHAYLKFSPTFVVVLSVLGIAVSLWQIISVVVTLQLSVVIALFSWVILWYVFFFVRRAFLKKKGVDLNAIMSTPFQEWDDREKELAAKA